MFPPDLRFDAFTIESIPACPEPFRRINRIPIRDNGEPLVDLRERNRDAVIADGCVPWVREHISAMLSVATSLLPDTRRLRISTALRTLPMQSEMYWRHYEALREKNPEWPSCTVRRQCNRFFAPPDTKAPPGHCTGGAVDVKLLAADGSDLDHSSPLEGWAAAPTAVAGLGEQARETRRLLCFVMHAAGFSNCRDEYWHWSWGDSAWAVRVGAPEACYGLVERTDATQ